MTPLSRALSAALVAAALSTTTGAQQSVRDGGAAAARRAGTAVIAGLVTLGDDAKTPVRRAVVTLTAADGSEKLAAISQDDGRFAIERVPAGRYTLDAVKPAHLTIVYGARRPGRRGTILIVAEGQRQTDLVLSLPLGAVLAGRVTLADGQPAANVQITAIPSWLATAGGTASGAREFLTDDLGDFRLFGLAPGTYMVAALPSFGRVEVERMSDAAISSVLRQLQQPGNPAGPAAASPVTITYAPTYFPGTPSVGDAARVTVATGQVREGLSFTISPFPAATLRGRVVGIDGTPTQAVRLSLEAIGPALPATSGAARWVGSPNAKGEFQIGGVSPGAYRLRGRAGGMTFDANGAGSTRASAQTQYGATDVSVSGQDVNGLLLSLHEGHRFTGTLTTDGSAPPPASYTGALVVVEPITAGPNDALAGILSPGVPRREGVVDESGRFTVTGVEPYDYEIHVALPPAMERAGWRLDSIRYADRDLRDAPLTFADGSLENATIRLTTAVTELDGRLTADSGLPATDYFVVAFPADRTQWHPTSPRVKVMRPAADGTFSTKDLPSGTYRLAVLIDVEDNEPRQREFLQSIYDASVEISLAPGRTTRSELRVGKRPDSR